MKGAEHGCHGWNRMRSCIPGRALRDGGTIMQVPGGAV